MRLALLISLFGALGALARWQVSEWAQKSSQTLLPLGTITVNILGSFMLGMLLSASLGEQVPESWRVPLATGFLGSFTTFSTFSVETIQLIQQGQLRAALLNLLIQLGVGLAAAAGGMALGRALGS
jgi:CrcB protein